MNYVIELQFLHDSKSKFPRSAHSNESIVHRNDARLREMILFQVIGYLFIHLYETPRFSHFFLTRISRIYVISFGLVKVLTPTISDRQRIGRPCCCPFPLSILLIRILLVVETPATLWHTFQLSRPRDRAYHFHRISNINRSFNQHFSVIFFFFYYYPLSVLLLILSRIKICLSLILLTDYWTVSR